MNYEFVTGWPCRLNCQPKYCDQSCPQGGCTITCPSDNKVCQQMCGPGKQCTKEIMPPPTTPATTTVTTAPPFVPDECESLEDGVCYQFCPGGSCVLECFNSTCYIIHVLNLAVVRILFHSICKFRWVCFTESDQFALIWQFLLKNNMTQYGDIQWSNTVKDSCSLHVRTITWWNQHSPVVNRTSFFFSGGNCSMTCSGPKYCLCSCSGGNCSTMFCEADTSKFDCAAGECETECYANSCEQNCTGGSFTV